MAEFIHAAPWVHAGGSSGTVTPSRLQSQLRTLSPPTNKTVTKSISSPQLKKFAHPLLGRSDSEVLNTIPDPRAATPQPAMTRNNSSDSSMHPDLSQEVATLSTKLIDAINHQTKLDDNLQQTRHELETARTRLAQLELQVKVHEQKVSQGLLVEKEVYDKMEKQLSSDLNEEKRRRIEAEKAKRKTDNEVENLTTALFEEANGMVATARKETEASEKRNDQLKQQLNDAEVLQLSLQEQLQDLKGVMEKMSAHGDDESNTWATTTAPSTPGITPADKMSKMFDTNGLTPNTPGSDEITPNHPLHFTHLIHPVLRSDLTSVKDFQEMLKTSSRSAPSSRVSSGNYGGLNVLGLGTLSNSSSSSLPISKSPNTPGSNSPRESLSGPTNLKDEKFYKRALSEDIEPTLRLDLAPGLSWMARRTVLNSITTGSLVVEPAPPPPKFRGVIFPCSLCGESRKGDEYARRFRFRSSENDETRHPLCDWCLGRIRSTCDYISFLRMVAAGHWKAESEEEKKAAWEESVRLRERMFWSRIGGGVVPSFIAIRDSPRSPTFANCAGKLDGARTSEESQVSEKPLDSAVDMSEPRGVRKSEDDPFQSKGEDKIKRVSIGNTVISGEPASTDTLTEEEEKKIEEAVEAQLQEEVRKSMDVKAAESQAQHQRPISMPASPEPSPKKDERLSLTIPGSFD
ncbi:Sec2p-domain-containing protein [Bimuria novae-zelandiae CBS 107.79]|uniref:Sec2p-domain-containing protein n=1 Tax=Bimuria novae-zelandiae CBS 107.79 TaxID=1447943 RepID=A0A6A5VQQ8_9PLEO|nr:Sec2p-domain-containing protein [Bimuria novae-zelandiae CBS 107.79]